jgi:hypothetical protein
MSEVNSGASSTAARMRDGSDPFSKRTTTSHKLGSDNNGVRAWCFSCNARRGLVMSTIRRRNLISGQFAARLIEMLESPAYRALSRSAHMVISRIEVELGHHAGNDNGRLPITTEDFVKYGMHRTSVAPAIREAEALGFIRVTERGRGGNAEYRKPNFFVLTFAENNRKFTPTHDWRKIKTPVEAERIARNARANKNPLAVSHGKNAWRKRQEKQKTGTDISIVSDRSTRTGTVDGPVRTNRTTRSGEKTVPLLYLGEGDAKQTTPARDAE